jgi:hypothetical protein
MAELIIIKILLFQSYLTLLEQRSAKLDSFDSFNSFLIWYDSFS